MDNEKQNETHYTLCTASTEPRNVPQTSVEAKEQETCVKTAATRSEPIMQFTSQEQLDESLKEWQERLGLRDWVITAELDDMDDNENAGGDNTLLTVQRTSRIRIDKEDCSIRLNGKKVTKYPQEMTLAHELLHCKFTVLEKPSGTYDGTIVEWREHCLIEDMAKALIMAKYGLTLEWFKV